MRLPTMLVFSWIAAACSSEADLAGANAQHLQTRTANATATNEKTEAKASTEDKPVTNIKVAKTSEASPQELVKADAAANDPAAGLGAADAQAADASAPAAVAAAAPATSAAPEGSEVPVTTLAAVAPTTEPAATPEPVTTQAPVTTPAPVTTLAAVTTPAPITTAAPVTTMAVVTVPPTTTMPPPVTVPRPASRIIKSSWYAASGPVRVTAALLNLLPDEYISKAVLSQDVGDPLKFCFHTNDAGASCTLPGNCSLMFPDPMTTNIITADQRGLFFGFDGPYQDNAGYCNYKVTVKHY